MPLKPLTGKGSRLNLPSLGLSLRVLFTGYLIVASIGLISAGGQLFDDTRHGRWPIWAFGG